MKTKSNAPGQRPYSYAFYALVAKKTEPKSSQSPLKIVADRAQIALERAMNICSNNTKCTMCGCGPATSNRITETGKIFGVNIAQAFHSN